MLHRALRPGAVLVSALIFAACSGGESPLTSSLDRPEAMPRVAAPTAATVSRLSPDASQQHIYVASLNDTIQTFTLSGVQTQPTIAWMDSPISGTVDANGKIYVVNSNDSITTYSENGTQLTPTLTGLANPVNVAVDASGKIYAVNSGSSTITTYTSDGEPTTPTISGLNEPTAVTVSASGTIFVAQAGNDTVTSYDANGTPTGLTISTGLNNPRSVAVDPSGNIFVTNAYRKFGNTDGTVTAYASDGSYTGTIATGLKYPSCVVAQNGDLYVTAKLGENIGAVYTYTESGTELSRMRTFRIGAADPLPDGHIATMGPYGLKEYNSNGITTIGVSPPGLEGVAVDSRGVIYALLTSDPRETVEAFSPTGVRMAPYFYASSVPSGYGIAVGANDTIYITNGFPAAIDTFSSAGQQIAPTITSGLSLPLGLAVANNIYVADYQAGKIDTFTLSGAPTTPTISGLTWPTSVGVYNGIIYVVQEGAFNGTVTEYTQSGTQVGPTISGLSNPRGIAFDADGNIYVDDYGAGEIEAFNQLGAAVGPTITGLTTPFAIAIH
jgi:hypothetical protein